MVTGLVSVNGNTQETGDTHPLALQVADSPKKKFDVPSTLETVSVRETPSCHVDPVFRPRFHYPLIRAGDLLQQ